MEKIKDEIVFRILGLLIDAECKEDDSWNSAIEQCVTTVKDTFTELGE